MAKGGFYSRLVSNEITTCGYMVLTFAKSTTIIIVVLAVTSGMGSSCDLMVWYGLDGNGMVLVYPVWSGMIYRP
jgi:hypothetical protein